VTVSPMLPWYSNDSVIYSALVSLLLSLSVATAVASRGTIRRMEQEAAQNRIASLQKQLEFDRTNVLLAQISSHFFYHTLNAIQALIVLDPDAAYKMTEDFSRFLRFKVDSVSAQSGLVPFREELRTVRAYAEINKVQLQGRLNVEYDVFDADFLIPVLTIQPVVENAIIHGIKPKVGGGTVRVSLSREDGQYIVHVSDHARRGDERTLGRHTEHSHTHGAVPRMFDAGGKLARSRHDRLPHLCRQPDQRIRIMRRPCARRTHEDNIG